MNEPAVPTAPPRRTWLQLGSLWLALLVVLANALDPVGPALEARTGSAFNAFSSDVSLGPVRNQEPAKARSGANHRDRHLRLPGGGGAAVLPAPLARTTFATLTFPPAAALTLTLPGQGTPSTLHARAPPRA